MRSDKTQPTIRIRRVAAMTNAQPLPVLALVWALLFSVTIASAIWTKETQALPALIGLSNDAQTAPTDEPAPVEIEPVVFSEPEPIELDLMATVEPETETVVDQRPELFEPGTRWFDGRRVIKSRVVVMKVTGYSPDARSCGPYADGQTATLKSVWTNGMRLVAADPKVLPYHSMVSVPGYAQNEIVPVLDCGAAIKGYELDLLFPTHEQALRWGVRSIPITIWEYADEE